LLGIPTGFSQWDSGTFPLGRPLREPLEVLASAGAGAGMARRQREGCSWPGPPLLRPEWNLSAHSGLCNAAWEREGTVLLKS
jgi:hypothetical protein